MTTISTMNGTPSLADFRNLELKKQIKDHKQLTQFLYTAGWVALTALAVMVIVAQFSGNEMNMLADTSRKAIFYSTGSAVVVAFAAAMFFHHKHTKSVSEWKLAKLSYEKANDNPRYLAAIARRKMTIHDLPKDQY